MPPIFNFKGYTKHDPLDKAPVIMQYAIMMLVTTIISILLVYAITDLFKLLEFKTFGVKVMEVLVFSLLTAPLIIVLRKSSSLILILIIFIPLFLFDLFLQANVRDKGEIALWSYLPGTFIDDVKILPLRFLMTLSFDALIFGPVCLWISRSIALIFYKNREVELPPTLEEQNNLFKEEWSGEFVEKPKRDAGYWILKILGYAYLSYLMILFIGVLGATPWPTEVSGLIEMTYKNPALAINTFSKIGIMILLTFIGAYNIHVRYYCVWGLIAGHSVSTISSLAFYFYDSPGTDYRDFLLTSAIVDGVMILLFTYILLTCKKFTFSISEEKDLPKYFSTPSQLVKISFIIIAIVSVLITLLAIYLRLFTAGNSGLEAIYGYPDPTLGNTFTLYMTVAFISILLAKSEKLRHYLFGVLLFPFFVGALLTVPLFIIKDLSGEFLIYTRGGNLIQADWYFMFFIIFNIIIFILLISLRKMYYNVDFMISSISPSSAKNVIALADAFYENNSKNKSSILIMIDQYIGGIRGRKRGLLNFPFWVVENVLNVICGLRPNFSVMSREEQRWFLKKYILRSPAECSKGFVPLIADFSFQIGLAVNAMIMFANYSNLNTRNDIGYVPQDARDRLQGDTPLYEPPFENIASLPKDPNDKLNNKNELPKPSQPFIAPRVTTPVYEENIPNEIDYLIIGSGAGGATMSYRLACEVQDPSKILVIERGSRYQPLQDFNNSEMEMMRKLYKEGGLQQTKKFTMSVLQGECVGGTTVMNNAVCIEMRAETKAKWQNEFDIDLSDLSAEYDQIAKELEIKELTKDGINKKVSEKFQKGVSGYNLTANEKLET
ncbi:MAG: GMC family oxidoreductase N-terminal domain-containing protein, partial [Ignavibacteria bacterium]